MIHKVLPSRHAAAEQALGWVLAKALGLSRGLKIFKKTTQRNRIKPPTIGFGTVAFGARIKNRSICIYCTGEEQTIICTPVCRDLLYTH